MHLLRKTYIVKNNLRIFPSEINLYFWFVEENGGEEMLLSTGKEQEARNARQTGRGHIRHIY
jgi:hypothetical protein